MTPLTIRLGTAKEWAFGPICPDFKVHRINDLWTNNRTRREIFGGYRSDIEESNDRNARLCSDMPDDLRGFCGDSIQTFRELPGGPGEQEDL
jgi:hypothetical protein